MKQSLSLKLHSHSLSCTSSLCIRSIWMLVWVVSFWHQWDRRWRNFPVTWEWNRRWWRRCRWQFPDRLRKGETRHEDVRIRWGLVWMRMSSWTCFMVPIQWNWSLIDLRMMLEVWKCSSIWRFSQLISFRFCWFQCVLCVCR